MHSQYIECDFVSFDGTESCRAELCEPDRVRGLEDALSAASPISIRGAGLSYCQASVVRGGHVVSSAAFDRILALGDGWIRVESGVSVGELERFLQRRGSTFPVLPGHPSITIGGSVAFNVHGKSQHDVGHFGDHIEQMTVIGPDLARIECGPSVESEVFDLTIGGMGLTGFIADVTLRVAPLTGSAVRRRIHRADDLVHAVEVMESLATSGSRLYSWNDLSRGSRFGRGVVYEDSVESGSPTSADRPYNELTASGRSKLPINAFTLLGRRGVQLLNRTYGSIERSRSDRVLSALDAAFPINGREAYFHAHGRRGFREYQLIVSRGAWNDATGRIRSLIERSGAHVSLGSLKLFSGSTRNLWFRGEGVCLTIDTANTPESIELFGGLDDLAIELGAPMNIAKDSRLDAATVQAVYPDYDRWRGRIMAHDPSRRFGSQLRDRIGV